MFVTWKDSRYIAAAACLLVYQFMGFFASSSECQQLHFTCFWQRDCFAENEKRCNIVVYATYILTNLCICM
jgi:hypothetical protein